jgi:hypothetical protein
MRKVIAVFLLAVVTLAQTPVEQIPAEDAVRVREFYRLAARLQDQIWPNWSLVAAPLMLVTERAEFLTHHLSPPKEFQKTNDDVYACPRQFPLNFEATFPAFGPPAVIVIGEPRNTASKTSTPWVITVMHEHFHQLQWAQPGYYEEVEKLGLSHGDNTGMWMLNYPFPYEKADVAQEFSKLRQLLLAALNESDKNKFSNLARQYVAERKNFFSLVSPDDRKYFEFQLWQEGIARYTQIKVAEAAIKYQPSGEFAALPDYTPFSELAGKARADTLRELQDADLAKWKRVVVYSFGGAQGLLLDRLYAKWKEEYFKHPLSTDALFDSVTR